MFCFFIKVPMQQMYNQSCYTLPFGDCLSLENSELEVCEDVRRTEFSGDIFSLFVYQDCFLLLLIHLTYSSTTTATAAM